MAKPSMTTRLQETRLGKLVGRNIGSNRALWTWIIGVFYIGVSIYALIKHPTSANTVVATAGAVLTMVFTNYVFSHNSDKKLHIVDPDDDFGESD